MVKRQFWTSFSLTLAVYLLGIAAAVWVIRPPEAPAAEPVREAVQYRPDPEEFEAVGLPYDPGVRFYRGSGCPMCFGTGYRGRTGVFEILVIDRALRSRITGGATREELKDAIERTGSFKTMEDSCRELVLTGVTTVEEARKTITALE